MKKFISSFLVALVLIVFFVSRNKAPAPKSAAPEQSSSDRFDPRKAFHKLFRGQRKILYSPNTVQSMSDEERKCIDSYEDLQRLDLTDFLETFPPRMLSLPKLDNCVNPPEYMKKIQADYLKNCSSFVGQGAAPVIPATKEEWMKNNESCMNSLAWLRARITEFKTKDQPIASIKDLKILGDKLFNEFFGIFNQLDGTTDKVDVEALKRMKALADRMLQIEPQLYGAARVAALSSFLQIVSTPNKSEISPEMWSATLKDVERMAEFDNTDTTIRELELFAKTQGLKPELLREELDAFQQKTAGSGLVDYYRAWREYKAGEKGNALKFLMRAQATNPSEKRYQETADKIRNKSSKDPFTMNFNVKFSTEDFLGK